MNNRNIISGTGLFLVACLFVAVIILVNATLTNWRLDLTENKLFTLSDGTINIIRNLDEPVKLDFYFSQKAMTGLPVLTNYAVRVRDMLQEYETNSGGKIILKIIDPEPFSEEEDQAVAKGLQGVAVNNAGDRAYLGLVGTNSTDDERIIPFFQSNRESALEYDITKLIYNLDHPKKLVIGVMSTLPVFGNDQQPGMKPWTIISAMKEFFDVRDLGIKVDVISPDIDVLMIIHPKKLKAGTQFASLSDTNSYIDSTLALRMYNESAGSSESITAAATQCNKVWFASTDNTTITLPDAGDAGAGCVITVVWAGDDAKRVTVSPAGTDGIPGSCVGDAVADNPDVVDFSGSNGSSGTPMRFATSRPRSPACVRVDFVFQGMGVFYPF